MGHGILPKTKPENVKKLIEFVRELQFMSFDLDKINHPKVKFGKTGVLLVNLGTPDSTSWWDIRKYLKEFLSDTRVIEVNPVLWQIILNLFILTFRPSKTAHAYKQDLDERY